MTKRFRMIFSILCALALLFTCIAVSAEEGQPENPDVEITDIEIPEGLQNTEGTGGEEPAETPAEEPAEPAAEEPAEPAAEEPAVQPAEEPATEPDEPATENQPAEEPAQAENAETPADVPVQNEPAQNEPAPEPAPAEPEATPQEVVSESVVIDIEQNEEKPAPETEPEPVTPAEEPAPVENEPESVPAPEDTETTEETKPAKEIWVDGEPWKDTLKAGKEFKITIQPIVTGEIIITIKTDKGFDPEKEEIKFLIDSDEREFKKVEEESTEESTTWTKTIYVQYGKTYELTILSEKDAELVLTVINKHQEEEPQEQIEENEPEETTEDKSEDETEQEESTEKNQPEEEQIETERKVTVSLSWDDEKPTYGSVAHLKATLEGYEGLEYTMQWQWSLDRTTWNDIEYATTENLDVVYTEENGDYYWRILVDVQSPAGN